jgi:hypothetical protein
MGVQLPQSSMANSCEYGNKLDAIKGRQLLEELSDYQLCQKDSI